MIGRRVQLEVPMLLSFSHMLTWQVTLLSLFPSPSHIFVIICNLIYFLSDPCPRLTVTPGVLGIAILAGLENTTFAHQSETYYNRRPVYISEIPSRPLFIYFDEETKLWTLAMGYGYVVYIFCKIYLLVFTFFSLLALTIQSAVSFYLFQRQLLFIIHSIVQIYCTILLTLN